jgi:hypothetical protein
MDRLLCRSDLQIAIAYAIAAPEVIAIWRSLLQEGDVS